MKKERGHLRAICKHTQKKRSKGKEEGRKGKNMKVIICLNVSLINGKGSPLKWFILRPKVLFFVFSCCTRPHLHRITCRLRHS